MSDIAIKFENISKEYRLGMIGTGTLSHDLKRWWTINIRGKEDPYLKIGETNDRSVRGSSEFVWALKDINLEVREGEVLGIIGRNGAGKSTLLKLLSRVTTPTTGVIKAKGRIASLLEVGTGFHPEMTGRENIFMNGSIMGMTKAEIRKRFDEIVEFAGVARYVDTPVKRYSSGMMVRLGFAIAAHLEPEILVVDEVLAVGDAEFQKKAIGKMQDVSRAKGRTVLFVSHNLNAIKSLCERSILLSFGEITGNGNTVSIISQYLSGDVGIKNHLNFDEGVIGDEICTLLKADVKSENDRNLGHYPIDKELVIGFSFKIKKKTRGIPNIHIFTGDWSHVLFSAGDQLDYDEGVFTASFSIPGNFLNTGTYIIGLAFTTLNPYHINFYLKDGLTFEVTEDINNRIFDYVGQIPGVVRPKLKWKVERLNKQKINARFF